MSRCSFSRVRPLPCTVFPPRSLVGGRIPGSPLTACICLVRLSHHTSFSLRASEVEESSVTRDVEDEISHLTLNGGIRRELLSVPSLISGQSRPTVSPQLQSTSASQSNFLRCTSSQASHENTSAAPRTLKGHCTASSPVPSLQRAPYCAPRSKPRVTQQTPTTPLSQSEINPPTTPSFRDYKVTYPTRTRVHIHPGARITYPGFHDIPPPKALLVEEHTDPIDQLTRSPIERLSRSLVRAAGRRLLSAITTHTWYPCCGNVSVAITVA